MIPTANIVDQTSLFNDSITSRLDRIRTSVMQNLERDRQSELGQFLTNPSIAGYMASMFKHCQEAINLIDAGAGVGTLTAAYILNALHSDFLPKQIHADLFEIDPIMVQGLRATMDECKNYCDQMDVKFTYNVIQEDFIEYSVPRLLNQGLQRTPSPQQSLLPSVERKTYNCAILNPPYHKINTSSKTYRLLKSIGIETTNLYSAFLWLVSKQIEVDGEMVAIIPRSFCNGTYYRLFRKDFLETMAIERIHVYGSRKKAFREDDVLQENIIIKTTRSTQKYPKVIISSSESPDDEDVISREVDYDQVVKPDDPDAFIHIVTDGLGQQISLQMSRLKSSLQDIGLSVSTGRVVDFRVRKYLHEQSGQNTVPLIYPGNFVNGIVQWPKEGIKKPCAIEYTYDTKSLIIPSATYVLVKRFSAKEERRRISAVIFTPQSIPYPQVGIENHLNYFHHRYGGISITMAKGLTAYLNSTLVDQYFRQFSGHTQVNAADLRKMKYPSEKQLSRIGERIQDVFPGQDEIDQIMREELALENNESNPQQGDPISAKKKIREALDILQMLNLPRAQQNDRSSLTLLALLDIQSSTPWQKASAPLMGITEMMNYFREHFGVDYAPNTRETVRRQTVHQFMELGLIVANPDDPKRPINSPKTKYQIEPKVLNLLQTYASPDWDGNLHQYLKEAPKLAALHDREREMTMIPVHLPDGSQIKLSEGGQNILIKAVIEEFCPRYTPGGKVVYVGDAGEKITPDEYHYLEQLGVKIEKHGKMPDVVIHMMDRNWLILVEAVTSHGPIDHLRHNELKTLFSGCTCGLVFVTAFPDRKTFTRYSREIDWETEVWTADHPTHLIHFNGERFLGPYEQS